MASSSSSSSDPVHLTNNPPEIKSFLDKFDVFLIDCDGVLWSGDHGFDGIPETIAYLQSLGKRTVFVTNNSSKSRRDNLAKLQRMHIPSTEDDVFGSAYSAAIYISRILKLPAPRNKVFVIGMSGIEAELDAEGIPHLGGTDPAFRREFDLAADAPALADGSALDDSVGAVLAGIDFHINYLKLAHAHQYLRRGAVFLATNLDSSLPVAHTFFPGGGAVLSPLVAAMSTNSGSGDGKTGATPLSLGKPSLAMLEAVEGKFKLDRARTCMIGDRLDTDIRFGIEGGLGGTLHVLTGVNSKEDWRPSGDGEATVPSYYADSLSDLLHAKST